MPTFDLERTFTQNVIGIDEAGRGPWAGPVVVAGVQFLTYDTLPHWVQNLNDSKKVSLKKREQLYNEILTSRELTYHISIVDVETIDRLNILEATMEGMRQCIQSLRTHDQSVLIDGNRKPINEPWCHTVVKGDGISLSIAAASILAKVHRDHLMKHLASEYPQYGWEKNAGYGTAFHHAALKEYGITPHHRKSFAPIRDLGV
jgi:ribonuclease HII